ncbi:MAG: OadG family protein [Anaerolineae bacterium]
MIENPWGTVLMITVLGMGLLFLALTFFYGLLTAMARLLQDRAGARKEHRAVAPVQPVTEPQSVVAGSEEEARWQAAVVAVALARAALPAARTHGPARPSTGEAAASAWWSLHHQRRLGRETRQGRSL